MNQAAFPTRHPYQAVAFLFGTVLAIFLASGAVVGVLGLAPWSLHIIAFVTLAGVCAALLAATGWWGEVGFRAPYQRRLLWLFWLPLVPVIGNLLDGIPPTAPTQIVLFLIVALLSGLVEETLFRGLVLRALLPTGAWRAALISAALFGGLHALNALSASSPAFALLQVGYATAIGFAYAALVIRTGTIWPLILAHVLTNFAGFLAAGGAGSTGPVAAREVVFAAVYMILFGAYGLTLLRTDRPAGAAPPWRVTGWPAGTGCDGRGGGSH